MIVLASSSTYVQYVMDSVAYGSLFALMALSLSLLFGVMGLMNFAYGELIGIGAYTMFYTERYGWFVMVLATFATVIIGALLMEFILLLAGLVVFPTLGHALIAPLVYLAFTTLEGHFITPTIMGKHLLLSPLTVFLALVFWTWLWGPIGALLAVPLLIVSLIAINHLFPKEEAALPE